MVTKHDVFTLLESFGIRHDDVVTMHSSLREVGAIDGGADGLHFYREMTRLWRDALCTGGLLAYEIGIHQGNDVAAILVQNGFGCIERICDLSGIERVVLGRKESEI